MKRPYTTPVYVWVCCEGWNRLGPFEWVTLTEDGQSFVDETGTFILINDPYQHCWRDPKHPGISYRTPMVTTQRKHPHPMSGFIPTQRVSR